MPSFRKPEDEVSVQVKSTMDSCSVLITEWH